MAQMGADFAKMMLDALLPSPSKMSEVMGLNLANFGRPVPNVEIIAQHERRRKDLAKLQRTGGVQVASSTNTACKPDIPLDMKRASQFFPVPVSALQTGVTHRGRILRGTLVVDPMTMTSVQTVLEDEWGDLVQVFFYNSGNATKYRKGTKVVILEPFHKVMADGKFGVRVDNRQDVVFPSWVGPLAGDTATHWKEEGNRHFEAEELTAADRCYKIALDKSDLLIRVLSNSALVLIKLDQPHSALSAAATAYTLAPDSANAKPAYRIVQAAQALGESEVAEAFGAIQDSAPDTPSPLNNHVAEDRLIELLVNVPALGHSVDAAGDQGQAQTAKEDGDAAFGKEDFSEALACPLLRS
jgi:hypothetical protein